MTKEAKEKNAVIRWQLLTRAMAECKHFKKVDFNNIVINEFFFNLN